MCPLPCEAQKLKLKHNFISVFSPCGIVIRIRNPIELGRSHAVGGAMREEGSPAPVIDDIIGGLVPDFLREKINVEKPWEGLGMRLTMRHPLNRTL